MPSAPDGGVDLDALRAALGPRTAAVMLTNPSTLGLFERRITELLDAVHGAGALAYMDGANMNAIMGHFKPGAAGFDVMHFNLHKTFSTPHGGGGPGAGPVAVERRGWRRSCRARWSCATRTAPTAWSDRASARRRSAACAPTRATPASSCARTPTSAPTAAPGCAQVSEDAVLAANYLRARVGEAYELPYPRPCKHEFVATARPLKDATGVRTLDVAKRLIDYGFHPPTIYFPLIVEECLLIEPTETEALEDLDVFAEALLAIAREAREHRSWSMPRRSDAPVRRLDEATAARQPGAALARHDRCGDALPAVSGSRPDSRPRRAAPRCRARRRCCCCRCSWPAACSFDEPTPTPAAHAASVRDARAPRRGAPRRS